MVHKSILWRCATHTKCGKVVANLLAAQCAMNKMRRNHVPYILKMMGKIYLTARTPMWQWDYVTCMETERRRR